MYLSFPLEAGPSNIDQVRTVSVSVALALSVSEQLESVRDLSLDFWRDTMTPP